MYNSIYVRTDYAELAKVVHAVSGTVTTVFLCTRLWARSRRGLWLDDYILTAAWAFQLLGNGLMGASPAYGFNILTGTKHGTLLQFVGACCLYIAICLSKNAFATTLLRLATGWIRSVLHSVMLLGSAFTIAIIITSWVPACGITFDLIAIPNVCIAPGTMMWTQTGYALCMVVSDIILTTLPWVIMQNVKYIPAEEKWRVAFAMSFVGLAGLIEIARIAFSMSMPFHLFGELDFTYGIVATYCLIQAEAAVFIIAQTFPIIRVMLQGDVSSRASREASRVMSSSHEPASVANSKAKPSVSGMLTVDGHESLELVQLPNGRIVPADSEEGRAFKAEEAARPRQPEPEPMTPIAHSTTRTHKRPWSRRTSGATVDDDVQRAWVELGLSKRMLSRSPEPPPTGARM